MSGMVYVYRTPCNYAANSRPDCIHRVGLNWTSANQPAESEPSRCPEFVLLLLAFQNTHCKSLPNGLPFQGVMASAAA